MRYYPYKKDHAHCTWSLLLPIATGAAASGRTASVAAATTAETTTATSASSKEKSIEEKTQNSTAKQQLVNNQKNDEAYNQSYVKHHRTTIFLGTVVLTSLGQGLHVETLWVYLVFLENSTNKG